ncbi:MULTISPECIES: bifunctional diguanylate cyclase/phosphodiesterase [Bradyrhizobium]|uniref:Diguanylate cyclase/phosphodiesterase n=2 Tax=Bradyrhizobium TaxID=374 RepID=A0ABY0QFL2_9BRAD|nr:MULTISPECIES: EAL domain-containing protein [Bradyrhizobium]SDK15597.1 diguanylate cyclase/phosphodiesterase [Bradyrhizobium ottawaense]SEE50065.1 diguanylate cyclase/phosphodiesterase [Bradyrhizobium lablabi]SHM51062.1 diguanylate cyclase/phosphodiesterase [Bradyrhizobium lablabi]
MDSTGISSFKIAAAFRGGPIRWLILGGILLISAIAIGATLMAGNFRERALRNSERELENTVLLLARHFDQQLEDFEVVQKDLITFMRASGIATAENYQRRMSSQEIHLMLKSKMDALSYVGGVNVFDADGRLINASAAWPVPAVSVADRSYFKTFKSDPQSPAMLIEPVYSRITGVWTTVIARKVSAPNGEFLGVIGRGIEPVNFEKFFASVALGSGAAIAMHHRDGTLLARYPHVDEMIGKNFKAGAASQLQVFDLPHSTSRLTSPIDGKDRLISSRALTNFPIVIVAATTTAAALADWREQITMLIVVAGLSVLAISALLFLAVRKLSQQHRASQQRLTLEKQRLDTAVNNMTQGLLLFDSAQRLVICNQRYIEMYGLSAEVIKPGCSFHDVIAHREQTGSFDGDVDRYVRLVLRDVAHRNVMVIATPDGRSIQVVNEPLADGGWVVTHEDVTERRRAEERITHLAHYDALTDLPNRALFHEQLKRELPHAAPGQQLAVLYIDIDEFKSVNDSLGHMIGDELLKSVAVSLGACVRETDFVARLGGDEFAIVQTGVKSAADVSELVNRIFETIRTPYECLGHQVTTDASIGIALAPQDGSDLDQILKNADLAMYAAKAAGRRTSRFFEPAMEAEVRARRVLETDLRQAITDGGFEVYYQPCLSLQDNSITGCEALLRWRHPQRGMISPADFIPIAEETGLINQLGEWVLTTACREAATWPDHVKLAVNVSPVQFKSGTLALKVITALAASGLAASRLELEITEAVLIRDDDAALAILHQLRDIGVRIALDDFGTGYSSLSYLQRFPFDKIKIDRCFVTDLASPEGSSSIVQAVVNIAADRRMTTTAEGVETEQQRELLRALGCSEMQGYLFSPPKPAADIRPLLTTHRQDPLAARPARKRKPVARSA